MEVRYIGESSPFGCQKGKIYVVISIEGEDNLKTYRIFDETGEDYLYSVNSFEVVGGSVSDVEGKDDNALFYLRQIEKGKEIPGQNLYDEARELLNISGRGDLEDYKGAFALLHEAASVGHIWAMNDLGMQYYRGYGVTQDFAEALRWFRKAASYGNGIAYENLAMMYKYGYGVEKNREVAKAMYMARAEGGSTAAMCYLGGMFEEGINGGPDHKSAFYWYSQGAELGDAACLDEVGKCYRDGVVVSQDYEKAMEYFSKAAELGDEYAMSDLGGMYYYGKGVEQDYSLAMYWGKRALEGIKMYKDMANIASLYENGEGVAKNYRVALAWYKKAVENGNDKSSEDVARLENILTEKGIAPVLDEEIEELTKSIYDKIHEAINSNGELPPNFSLRTDTPPDKIKWADGALDGICCYHNKFPTPDMKPMIRLLKEASDGYYGEADTLLLALFKDENHIMMAYIDEMQNWIFEHSAELDARHLYAFARSILLNSRHIEAIKFALSVLEIIQGELDDELKDAIRELGVSDEFTLFVLFVIANWEDGNEEIFEIAQNVHEWGRIHAVARLEADTEEIKNWLLFHGTDHFMPEYSGLEVANKIDLAEIIESNDADSSEFIAAGNVLQAVLLGDGGITNLDTSGEYDKVEAMAKAFVQKAQKAAPNGEMYDSLRTIKIYFNHKETEQAHQIVEKSSCMLKSGECTAYLKAELAKGKYLWLAAQIGIDCSKEIKEAFRRNWRKNYNYLSFLDKDNDILEMAEFFIENVQGKDIMHPCNIIIGSDGNMAYENLLEKLSGFSSQEEQMLLLGLKTPVKRTRSMTLERLRSWMERGKVTKELRKAIDIWHNEESDDELKEKYNDL